MAIDQSKFSPQIYTQKQNKTKKNNNNQTTQTPPPKKKTKKNNQSKTKTTTTTTKPQNNVLFPDNKEWYFFFGTPPPFFLHIYKNLAKINFTTCIRRIKINMLESWTHLSHFIFIIFLYVATPTKALGNHKWFILGERETENTMT